MSPGSRSQAMTLGRAKRSSLERTGCGAPPLRQTEVCRLFSNLNQGIDIFRQDYQAESKAWYAKSSPVLQLGSTSTSSCLFLTCAGLVRDVVDHDGLARGLIGPEVGRQRGSDAGPRGQASGVVLKSEVRSFNHLSELVTLIHCCCHMIRAYSKKDFSEEEMLRIWKGLHYCFWMSDKVSRNFCYIVVEVRDGFSAASRCLCKKSWPNASPTWFTLSKAPVRSMGLCYSLSMYKRYMLVVLVPDAITS